MKKDSVKDQRGCDSGKRRQIKASHRGGEEGGGVGDKRRELLGNPHQTRPCRGGGYVVGKTKRTSPSLERGPKQNGGRI